MKRLIHWIRKRPALLLGLGVLGCSAALAVWGVFCAREREFAPISPTHARERLYPAYSDYIGMPVPPVEVTGILREEANPTGRPQSRYILHLDAPIAVTFDLVDNVTYEPVDAGDAADVEVVPAIKTLDLEYFESGPVHHPIRPFLNKRIKVRGFLVDYVTNYRWADLFIQVDMDSGTNLVLVP